MDKSFIDWFFQNKAFYGHAGRPGMVGGSVPAHQAMSRSTGAAAVARMRGKPGSRISAANPDAPEPLKADKKMLLKKGKYTVVPDPDRKLGAFPSERVRIDGDGDAIRKPSPGHPKGLSENEAKAYDISLELGLDGLVPMTVFRKINDASFQEFVENSSNGYKLAGKPVKPVKAVNLENQEQWGQMLLLDMVIANSDRHLGNIMVSNDGGKRITAIDHGLSLQMFDSSMYDPIFGAYESLLDVSRTLGGYDNENPSVKIVDYKALYKLSSKHKAKLQSMIDRNAFVGYGREPELDAPMLENAKNIIAQWDDYFWE